MQVMCTDQFSSLASASNSKRQNQVDLVSGLNRRYSGALPRVILEVAIRDLFIDRIALVSSFGAESALLLFLLAEIDTSVPILFLNTDKHFDETLTYRDILIDRFGFSDVRSIEPDTDAINKYDPDGTLWQTNPNLCCQLRKVDPLQTALRPFDAWITGRKRYQTQTRSTLPAFESLDNRVKINPLAYLSEEEIDAAFRQYKLPRHPLYFEGFKSIGCKPCTLKVADGADTRSGRWSGTDKVECGIHR